MTKEWNDLGNDAEISIEDVMKIAEEEIRRTSQEAVKAAVIKAEGELAYEKERAKEFALLNDELELFNRELSGDLEEEKNKNARKFCSGILLGGAGGVLISSIICICVVCNNFCN